MMQPAVDPQKRGLTYGPFARTLHWLMAVLILLQVVMGVIMVYEGPEPNIWATLANALHLYDAHKSLGLVLLLLVLVRIANRVLVGAPPEQELTVWQRESSNFVHSWIYLLLLGVPLLGWIGISLYPAVVVFGTVTLPALTAPNRPVSETVLAAHRIAAFVLLGLVVLHISAALYHRFIRRDGVLARMWPGSRAKSSESARTPAE